jgi:hypothetical protein
MILKMIKRRLGEASTWKGIISLLVGFGLSLNGNQVDTIAIAISSVYAAFSIVTPDKVKED